MVFCEVVGEKINDNEFILGIVYICWVMYGKVSKENVYFYCVGEIFFVYNGIIENYVEF